MGALLAALVVLFAPRPEGSVTDHLHKEDGAIFLAEEVADSGFALTTAYTGYQHWWPRIIAAGCSELSPDQFSRCVTWSSHLFRIGLAGAAYLILVPLLRRRDWAALAAAVFVFVPVGQQEVLGNLTNLRWFADAFGVLALSVRVMRWRVAIPVAVVAALCAMSDPLALLIAPLALWHLWRPPTKAALLVPLTYAGATVLHWSMLESGARSADVGGVFSRFGETTEQLLVRGPMVAQFGQNGSEGMILVAGLPLALLACLLPVALLSFGLSRVPHRLRFTMGVWVAWGLGLLLVSISFADHNQIALTEYWRIGQASRYSVVPGVLIGMALVVAICALVKGQGRWGRVIGYVGLAALLGAVALDWSGEGWNVHGPKWSDTVRDAQQECARGASRVTVQVTPTDVPTRWEAELPCAWVSGDGR